MISANDPDYILEEYRGYIIASHKNNVPEKSLNNLIITYRKDKFPEGGFIVGLDDSKLGGGRRVYPHNMEDAKNYIDWLSESAVQRSSAENPEQLPTIEIEGTRFAVDVAKQELVQVTNSQNTISFAHMFDHRTHYSFEYNLERKNFRDWSCTGVEVKIPQMVELDPQGMVRHYGLARDDLKGKTDFDLIVNRELVRKRVSGLLPVIEIAGVPFYIDLKNECLRPKEDLRMHGIQFSEIDRYLLEDHGVYQFPYDPESRTVADLSLGQLREFPKELVMVEIPYKNGLDPVGYARWLGIDARDILRRFPPTEDMKAKILPWQQTYLAQIIKENREKFEQAKKTENKKAVKNVGKSSRKGRKM